MLDGGAFWNRRGSLIHSGEPASEKVAAVAAGRSRPRGDGFFFLLSCCVLVAAGGPGLARGARRPGDLRVRSGGADYSTGGAHGNHYLGASLLQGLGHGWAGSALRASGGGRSLGGAAAGFEPACAADQPPSHFGCEPFGGSRLCSRASDWRPAEGSEVGGGGCADCDFEFAAGVGPLFAGRSGAEFGAPAVGSRGGRLSCQIGARAALVAEETKPVFGLVLRRLCAASLDGGDRNFQCAVRDLGAGQGALQLDARPAGEHERQRRSGSTGWRAGSPSSRVSCHCGGGCQWSELWRRRFSCGRRMWRTMGRRGPLGRRRPRPRRRLQRSRRRRKRLQI